MANTVNPLVISVSLIIDQLVTLDQTKVAIEQSLNYLTKELFIKGKKVKKWLRTVYNHCIQLN